jgi:Zn-dependent protease with chaperone function
LQDEAARRPAAYRFKVFALALLGDVTLTTVQLLPIALVIGLPLFVLNAALVKGSLALINGAGVVAMVLLIWMTRPQHRFDGTEVTPKDAPDFFRQLDALREKLAMGPRMRVMIDDDFNASAAETRGALGFIGRQQTLTLGVPLLSVLSREQMLAVIGHEFGHFSRRHGRFGHWLYRARGGWMIFAEDVTDSDAVLDRAAAAFAERFVPYFSAYSFVLARQCEYEADADAASATSADAMACALTRMEVVSRLWGGGFRKMINRWRLAEAEAPADYLDRFTQALPGWPAQEFERWLQQALAEKPNWVDTHPLLAERVGALKQTAAIGAIGAIRAIEGPCAGEALFGAHWETIKRDFNQRWRKRMQPKWLFYREYRKHVVQPLLATDAEHAAALPAEAQLLRAEALMDEDAELAQQALIALAEQHVDDAEVSLRAGLALSERAPAHAMPLLQRVAPLEASYRAESFRGLRRLFEDLGDGKEADRYAARIDNAGKHAGRAYEVVYKALLKGDVQASTLSATAKSLIASAAQADACVAELWWFERDVAIPLKLASGEEKPVTYPMQVGLWVIDPELLRNAGENEDDVGERYCGYLQTLLLSNVLVSGKAVYTTENRERWLLDLMQKLPQACCFRRV